MANVLGDEKRHQVLTLGRLGWSLRRIEREIEEAVARGRNAMAIWQDLVDDHGFTAG